MADPVDRQTFKEYCLRRLGSGAINIEMTDDQADDRISDALQMYIDYHFDGTQKFYYKYQIQPVDIINRYITLPDNIIGVTSIFNMGVWAAFSNMFSFQYQFALNNIFDLTAMQMAPYYMSMQYMQMIEQVLVGQKPIRFNRNVGQLYLDMDWSQVQPGMFLMVETYQVIDPTVYPKVWNDRWLKEYTTAIMKEQWLGNLNKFKGQKLPGGMEFNVAGEYQDAKNEVKRLKQEIIDKYGGVLEFFEG